MLEQFVVPNQSVSTADEFGVPSEQLVELLATALATSSDRIGTDAPWPDQSEKTLLVCLTMLVERHFAENDGNFTHKFMSTEEEALGVLLYSGLMLP